MRKLTLRKEVLAPLTDTELTAVVGGAETKICLSDPCITPAPYTGLKCYLTDGCA
ncbi:MAG TPA: class I lanthipeptide [Mycobacteriales bacterium]